MAITVPSGGGTVTSFFVAQDGNKGLTFFGAAGSLGIRVGLILTQDVLHFSAGQIALWFLPMGIVSGPQ